jgi:hypothetical protein
VVPAAVSQPAAPQTADPTGLRLSTARGRWVVTATVLGSGMAALDATVVGIALPAIGRNFTPAWPACSGWSTRTR